MTTTTKHPEVDIILVGDRNRITKNCINSIKEDVNVIVEPFNGYNKSLNEGAKKGSAEYIAFCNNDLLFSDGWLQPLIDALEDYDSVSPWCKLTHRQWWNNAKPNNIYSSYEVGKCISGWFIMMKRETWEQIGGFDERFEFSVRLKPMIKTEHNIKEVLYYYDDNDKTSRSRYNTGRR